MWDVAADGRFILNTRHDGGNGVWQIGHDDTIEQLCQSGQFIDALSLVVDADKTIGADFAKPLLELDPGPNGSIALDPPGGVYDAGTVGLVGDVTPAPQFRLPSS